MRTLILLITFLSGSITFADVTNFNEIVAEVSAQESQTHKEFLEKIPDNQVALAFHEKMEEIKLRESLKETDFSVQLVDRR